MTSKKDMVIQKLLKENAELKSKIINLYIDKINTMSKTVIRCVTEEQAAELLEFANSIGLKWRDGSQYTSSETMFTKYKNNTCYNLKNGTFMSLENSKKNNFTIIPFENVILK